MALSSSPQAGARTQFTIDTQAAGSNGTAYTVPEGKNFVGYKVSRYPNDANYVGFTVNGVTMYSPYVPSYGTNAFMPIYLSGGDVVGNLSTYYFILTGYEE